MTKIVEELRKQDKMYIFASTDAITFNGNIGETFELYLDMSVILLHKSCDETLSLEDRMEWVDNIAKDFKAGLTGMYEAQQEGTTNED